MVEEVDKQVTEGVSAEVDPALADVDQLIKAEDPAFASHMQELFAILPASVDLSEQLLEINEASEAEVKVGSPGLSDPEPKHFLFKILFRLRESLFRLARKFIYLWEEYRQLGRAALQKQLRKLWHLIRSVLGSIWRGLKELPHFFGGLNWSQRLLLLVALLTAGGAVYWARFTLGGGKFSVLGDRYLPTLEQVADRQIKFDDTKEFSDFYATTNQPQFYVSLEKIVINLAASQRSTANPMGVFRLYIEGSSQDVIIEIKRREKEIRSLLLSALSRLTYDQLSSADGKAYLKVLVRKDLNEILNTGRVRRVLIDQFVLKP